jgi:hypothetical protein
VGLVKVGSQNSKAPRSRTVPSPSRHKLLVRPRRPHERSSGRNKSPVGLLSLSCGKMHRRRDKVKEWFKGSRQPRTEEPDLSISAQGGAATPPSEQSSVLLSNSSVFLGLHPLQTPSPLSPPAGIAQEAPSEDREPSGRVSVIPREPIVRSQSNPSLWDEAFADLPESDKALLGRFGGASSAEELRQQIQILVVAKQRLADENAWKFELNGRQIILRAWQVQGGWRCCGELRPGPRCIAMGCCSLYIAGERRLN